MMIKLAQRKQGFTIIELLIVIAIIAILAMVAIPALLKAQKSGKESAALQVLKSLRAAEETYKTRSTAAVKTYGTLAELYADKSSPVTQGGTEPQSGYKFESSGVGTDTYTITATHPAGDSFTDMRNYTLTEDGTITQN